jgi:hypothetical protein
MKVSFVTDGRVDSCPCSHVYECSLSLDLLHRLISGRYHHHQLPKEVGKEQARSICCSEVHKNTFACCSSR